MVGTDKATVFKPNMAFPQGWQVRAEDSRVLCKFLAVLLTTSLLGLLEECLNELPKRLGLPESASKDGHSVLKLTQDSPLKWMTGTCVALQSLTPSAWSPWGCRNILRGGGAGSNSGPAAGLKTPASRAPPGPRMFNGHPSFKTQ